MSKKNNQVTKFELTGAQLYELKFFCRNVVGCRQDFYSVKEKADAYDERLKRLEKTCNALEKFFGEKLTSLYDGSFE
jgi:hypothetical protein